MTPRFALLVIVSWSPIKPVEPQNKMRRIGSRVRRGLPLLTLNYAELRAGVFGRGGSHEFDPLKPYGWWRLVTKFPYVVLRKI